MGCYGLLRTRLQPYTEVLQLLLLLVILAPLLPSVSSTRLLDRTLLSGSSGRGLKQEQSQACDGSNSFCWMEEYAKFHREMRGKPEAKYIIWVCFGSDRGKDNVFMNDCAGLGDRLRGIEYTYRLAYSMQRVLLVYQEDPAPMETFFKPNLIDWRVTPDLGITITPDTPHFVLQDGGGWTPVAIETRQMLENGTLEAMQDRVITFATNNYLDKYAGKKPSVFPAMIPDRRALARAIFKPSDALQQRVDKVLADMGVGKDEEFIAFHLRLGGMKGESQRMLRHSLKNASDDEVMSIGRQCAQQLATHIYQQRKAALPEDQQQSANIAPPRIMLITDKAELREKAISGELKPWLSPNVQPVHMAMPDRINGVSAADVDLEKHLMSMVDFGIIQRASCAILTHSGFSQQARLLGTHSCTTALDSCLLYSPRDGNDELLGRMTVTG